MSIQVASLSARFRSIFNFNDFISCTLAIVACPRTPGAVKTLDGKKGGNKQLGGGKRD
jgi:hypothetical protein